MPKKLTNRKDSRRSLQRRVGQFGAFKNAEGTVYCCRIKKRLSDNLLMVQYWPADSVRIGWIGSKAFRTGSRS